MIVTETNESSSSNVEYRTQIDTSTGDSECTCPGFYIKKADKPKHCKHTKKLRKKHGFSEIPGENDTQAKPATASKNAPVKPLSFKPMLASAMTTKSLEDYCNDFWLLEEKYDGHRVVIEKKGASVLAWSRPRSGKEALARTLTPECRDAVKQLPDGIYDGEELVPGGKSSDVTSLVAQRRKILVLFDVVEMLGESLVNRTYHERREYLRLAVGHHAKAIGPDATDADVRIIMPTTRPVSEDSVQEIWDRGGEGAILKRVTSTYQPGKRSPDWVKVKREAVETMTVIGFEAGKNGPHSKIVLRSNDGVETSVKTKNNALLKDFMRDPQRFIGRRLVISYCEKTETGKPRHGMFDHWAGPGE